MPLSNRIRAAALTLRPDGRDGGIPLFESQAIVEYLDETQPGHRLAPSDARLRARDRAWFTYASEEIFTTSWKTESAKDAESYATQFASLRDKFKLVDAELNGRAYLSGDGTAFGLADLAFAPVLYRLAAWERLAGVKGIYEGLDNVAAWSARVLARDSLPKSVPPGWDKDVARLGQALGSHLASMMR